VRSERPKSLCERCKGEGFVMIPDPVRLGLSRRAGCEKCHGAGSKRCNVEAVTGQLCMLDPGHAGLHTAGNVEWASGRDDSTDWRKGWLVWTERGGWEPAECAEPPKADHVCELVPFPTEEELAKGTRFAVVCRAANAYRDVTDIIVRRFVMPWVEHAPRVEDVQGGA
jgi:hypothetical protein